jgi:hypothetical protein
MRRRRMNTTKQRTARQYAQIPGRGLQQSLRAANRAGRERPALGNGYFRRTLKIGLAASLRKAARLAGELSALMSRSPKASRLVSK